MQFAPRVFGRRPKMCRPAADEAPRGKRENTSGTQGNRNFVTILMDVGRLFRPFFWRD